MKADQWMEIERNGETLEINVEYDVTPFVSATYWQPAEGGEIEITAVFLDGKAIDPPLTDAEDAFVYEYIAKHHDDSVFDDGPDPDDWRDRCMDERLPTAFIGGDDA